MSDLRTAIREGEEALARQGWRDGMSAALNALRSLLAAAREAEAALAEARQDVIDAAGELLVPIPEPGTNEAKMMIAGRLMRHERDEARGRAASLSRELLDAMQARDSYRADVEALRNEMTARETDDKAIAAGALFAAEAKAERLAEALRHCARELQYVLDADPCEHWEIHQSGEAKACVALAESLLGPMRGWPEGPNAGMLAALAEVGE